MQPHLLFEDLFGVCVCVCVCVCVAPPPHLLSFNLFLPKQAIFSINLMIQELHPFIDRIIGGSSLEAAESLCLPHNVILKKI